MLADAGLEAADIDGTATTADGENVKFATGHSCSMTTHARGGVCLEPTARAVKEIGSLSQSSKQPEKVSSICAVLAETDACKPVRPNEAIAVGDPIYIIDA